MLELVIITIALFVIFILAMWFAHYRSKQRSKLLALEQESYDYIPEKPEHEFGTLFQKEMNDSVVEPSVHTVDSEPNVSISQAARMRGREVEDASLVSTVPIAEQSHVDEPSPKISTIEPELTTEQIDLAKLSSNNEPNSEQLVIALTVIAKSETFFIPVELKAVLEALSLRFGDSLIYHRLSQRGRQPLFSVANMMQPGTLSFQDNTDIAIKGLALFMTMPQVTNSLVVFDEMLDTAIKIADKLNADLCDEQRQALTDSTIERLRSQILTFNLSLQSEQNQFKYDHSR